MFLASSSKYQMTTQANLPINQNMAFANCWSALQNHWEGFQDYISPKGIKKNIQFPHLSPNAIIHVHTPKWKTKQEHHLQCSLEKNINATYERICTIRHVFLHFWICHKFPYMVQSRITNIKNQQGLNNLTSMVHHSIHILEIKFRGGYNLDKVSSQNCRQIDNARFPTLSTSYRSLFFILSLFHKQITCDHIVPLPPFTVFLERRMAFFLGRKMSPT